MNILTVCQHGNVRSVGTRSRLTKQGYRDVIAIGADSFGWYGKHELKVIIDKQLASLGDRLDG